MDRRFFPERTHFISGMFDTFFQPKAGSLSPAQSLGAPLIPIGLGVAALAVLVKSPKFAPIGIAMSAAGIALLAIARKKQDDTLAQQGIVSGDFPRGTTHPNWIYDQNSYGWIPG
jgi:hypothetical protein